MVNSLPSGALSSIPVEIRVCVGTARPTIAQLMDFQQDSIVELDRAISDPVELYVGDKLIARGELEEIEGLPAGRLGVRLIEVVAMDQPT